MPSAKSISYTGEEPFERVMVSVSMDYFSSHQLDYQPGAGENKGQLPIKHGAVARFNRHYPAFDDQ